MTERKRNYGKLFGATFIWAFFNGCLIASLSQNRKSVRAVRQAYPTTFGMWTGIIGAVMAALHFGFDYRKTGKNPFLGLRSRHLWTLAALGLVTGAGNVCWYTVLGMHQAANGTLVHSLAYPLSVLPLVFFLKETLRPAHVAAVILGFAGTMVVAWPKGGARFGLDAWLGFALLAALGLVGEIFFTTLLGRMNVPERVCAFAKLLFQIPTMFVGARLLGHSLAFGNVAAIAKGIFGGLLLYGSFLMVFGSVGDEREGKVPGRDWGIIGYHERLWTVFFAIVIFGEAFTRNIVIGGACMALAELFIVFGKKKQIIPTIQTPAA